MKKKSSLTCKKGQYSLCPGSSDPFYIVTLLYRMGPYFLEIINLFTLIMTGEGKYALTTFLVFLTLKTKETQIVCLSCDFCNVSMNAFDFIGIFQKTP